VERRDFLKSTVAIASVAAASRAAAALMPAAASAAHGLVGAVVVDNRFGDSRRFAEVYAARGASVISLAEDIGRLWYSRLGALCAQPGTVIAGLTLHTDLFVSQQFARECGKSLLQFGSHDCRGRNTLVHTVPAYALSAVSGESWATKTARCMLDAPTFASRQQQTIATDTIRAADHPGSLYSWLIV